MRCCGKKCHALRIASYQARTEGWLAEHMLIVGLQSPTGETHYIAAKLFLRRAARPTLAMLIPPQSMPGWKVFTVGDDSSPGCTPGADGRLWAINPEAGYFGVAPGTNPETNRNAYDMIRHDTLFTNVRPDGGQPSPGGKVSRKALRSSTGRDVLTRSPTARPRIRIRASRFPPATTPVIPRTPRGSQGCAHHRHCFRGPAPHTRAAGLPGPRLGLHGVLVGASVASGELPPRPPVR